MGVLIYIVPVFALAALCAGWVAVQFLARRMRTKNHFEHGNPSCSQCAPSDIATGCACESEDIRRN